MISISNLVTKHWNEHSKQPEKLGPLNHDSGSNYAKLPDNRRLHNQWLTKEDEQKRD